MSAENPKSSLEGGLDADRGGSVVACASIFIVSCTLFMALRWYSQRVAKRGLFVEDWLMVAAYIVMMGLCANVICSKFNHPSQVDHIYQLTQGVIRCGIWLCRSTRGMGSYQQAHCNDNLGPNAFRHGNHIWHSDSHREIINSPSLSSNIPCSKMVSIPGPFLDCLGLGMGN